MKTILALTLLSLSFSAFSFTSITLNKDVLLKTSTMSNKLFANESEYKNNKSCVVTLHSNANQEILVVKKGTTLTVEGNVFNECSRDWGRLCSVTFFTENKDLDLSATVTCKEKGMLATKMTVEKANKIGAKILTIK